jgi:hypothetical protein
MTWTERVAAIHREVVADTAKETGWPLELCEARGLCPSEAGVVRAVADGRELTPALEGWLDQVELWGLIERDGDGWQLTEWGAKVNPLLYSD